jgi:hypothetical protein
MRGKKRCRLHGGKSTGAPKGHRNGNYRTGLHTIEMKAQMRAAQDTIKEARRFVRSL